jgi:2,3-bisphosphoglycerate-dependent phosphoglycerate mutase
MLRLYLIRHGQSTNNAQPNFSKHEFEPPLTEVGVQESLAVANHLRYGSDNGALSHGYDIHHIYSSPQLRSLQTTVPLSQHFNCRPEIWVQTHERGGVAILHHKGVQHQPGLTRPEIMTQFPMFKIPHQITDKGWWRGREKLESNDEVNIRARIVANGLFIKARTSQDIGVVMVSHNTFMNSLAQLLLKDHDGRYLHHNGGISRIDIYPNSQATLQYLNWTHHLNQTWVS